MLLSQADDDLVAAVRAQFHAAPPARLGIAISGGGDSTALLHLLARCFDPAEVEMFAATVDHGLRPEAADEARQAGLLARSLGISHDILKWQGWDGAGNLQDQARRARYSLLADWAKSKSIAVVALGHTADDQAETVLMRLARASGVTGLAAMPVRRTTHGITVFRPLLGITRVDLRTYLTQHDIAWIDDPSNDNIRFDRIKARRAIEALEPLGLTATVLADVAKNMAQAREALDWYSFLAGRDVVTIIGGDVVLDLNKFRALPDEIARRLFSRALVWISSADYPPRRAALAGALKAVNLDTPATLCGCRVLRQGRRVWICREFNAVRDTQTSCDQIWDGRWHLYGGDVQGCDVRPLGQRGLRMVPDWREIGLPGAALPATPAVWRGDELVAAPLAGMANGWTAKLVGGSEEFFASLLSH